MSTISFGTDGWRGVISKDFTIANLQKVITAIGTHFRLQQTDSAQLVVGYDARFMSQLYAQTTAEILADLGIQVLLSREVCSTPALSLAVTHYQAPGGIMITASHNPYYYNGVKIKESFGGSALPQTTQAIEELLAKPISLPKKNGSITPIDVQKLYFAQLKSLVEFDKLQRSKIKLVVDPMFGSCINYLSNLSSGCSNLDIVEINNYHNPGFNGINPEPIQVNLTQLQKAVRATGADLGLAFDGDGDRLGAVDQFGNFISPQYIFPLLVESYLKRAPDSGLGIGKTFSTTALTDKLCQHYGTTVFETPIGFKYLCQLFLDRKVALAGEESGGFGFADHLPERDGILSALRLLAYLAETGLPLHELIRAQQRQFGSHFYRRMDFLLSEESKLQLLNRLVNDPPSKIGQDRVTAVHTLDGYKFFTRYGWLLLRFSGTEPLLRVYAEAETLAVVNTYLNHAETLIRHGRG